MSARDPCSHCGGVLRVVDSRYSEPQVIRRRIRCSGCGEKMTTYELPVARYRAMRANYQQLRIDLRDAINEVMEKHLLDGDGL